MLAAHEPSRSFPYWLGGVRFSDAPDAIEPDSDGKTTVPLLGGPGIAADPRWRDMHIKGTSVTRFGRTLALEPEQEGDGWARVLRRELVLDRDETSEAIFQSESSACPLEFTVHLVLQEVSSLWEAEESESRVRPVAEEREVEILGRVTLIAHEVSSTPEVFDLDQRVVRLHARTELRPLDQSRLRVLPLTLEAPDPERRVLRVDGIQEHR